MRNQITSDQALRMIDLLRKTIDVGKAGTDVQPLTEMGIFAEVGQILDLEVVQPQYKHDCDEDCKYLGRYQAYSGNEEYDLYFHPQGGLNAALIARRGDLPMAYDTVAVRLAADRRLTAELDEARRRARLMGLMA